MGVALALAGLVTMIVAVIGLARGRVNWARLRKRQHAALALAAGLILFVIGAALAPAQKQSPAANSTPRLNRLPVRRHRRGLSRSRPPAPPS